MDLGGFSGICSTVHGDFLLPFSQFNTRGQYFPDKGIAPFDFRSGKRNRLKENAFVFARYSKQFGNYVYAFFSVKTVKKKTNVYVA
jgi:hypothetical protein